MLLMLYGFLPFFLPNLYVVVHMGVPSAPSPRRYDLGLLLYVCRFWVARVGSATGHWDDHGYAWRGYVWFFRLVALVQYGFLRGRPLMELFGAVAVLVGVGAVGGEGEPSAKGTVLAVARTDKSCILQCAFCFSLHLGGWPRVNALGRGRPRRVPRRVRHLADLRVRRLDRLCGVSLVQFLPLGHQATDDSMRYM